MKVRRRSNLFGNVIAVLVLIALFLLWMSAYPAKAQSLLVQESNAGTKNESVFYEVGQKVDLPSLDTSLYLSGDWLSAARSGSLGLGVVYSPFPGLTLIPISQLSMTLTDDETKLGYTQVLKVFGSHNGLSGVFIGKWKILQDVPDFFFTNSLVARELTRSESTGVRLDLMVEMVGTINTRGDVRMSVGPGMIMRFWRVPDTDKDIWRAHLRASAQYGVGNASDHEWRALMTLVMPLPIIDLVRN